MTATFISNPPLQHCNMGHGRPANWKDQLYEAVRNNDFSQIKALADRGCNLSASIGPEKKPALSYACAQTDNNGLAWFLLNKNVDPNGNRDIVDFDTPLMQATIKNRISLMKELLKKGADVHSRATDISTTPLYNALIKQHFDSAKVLLDNGAYEDVIIVEIIGLLADPSFTATPENDEKIKEIKIFVREFQHSQRVETSQQVRYPHHAIIP